MNIRQNSSALFYSIITLALTFFVGELLLIFYPNGNNIVASLLFILINLLPMIVAILFTINERRYKISRTLKNIFIQRESLISYTLSFSAILVYYGVSTLLNNVKYMEATIEAVLAYMPWAILQGGLEEVGWRWYLQSRLKVKSFFVKMILISIVWFVWHIPIYRLPWITAGSSNYFIFYLMILGNTFMFGVIKEFSKGAVPCILTHILIDTFAVAMLVQSELLFIIILVVIEIFISLIIFNFKKKDDRQLRKILKNNGYC